MKKSIHISIGIILFCLSQFAYGVTINIDTYIALHGDFDTALTEAISDANPGDIIEFPSTASGSYVFTTIEEFAATATDLSFVGNGVIESTKTYGTRITFSNSSKISFDDLEFENVRIKFSESTDVSVTNSSFEHSENSYRAYKKNKQPI